VKVLRQPRVEGGFVIVRFIARSERAMNCPTTNDTSSSSGCKRKQNHCMSHGQKSLGSIEWV